MKETRKQLIRAAVKEMLPEILSDIVKSQQYDQLKDKVESRLTEVEKYIKETTELMNVRQKEVLKYLLESYMAALKQPNPAVDEEKSE